MMPPPALPPLATWRPLVDRALAEDIGPGDVTTQLAIPETSIGQARIEAREPIIVCGLEIAAEVFRAVDPKLSFEPQLHDGEHAPIGAILAVVSGPMRSILTGERTALNFLTRLCGIATFTRRFVEAVVGTGAVIVDTRKTLPGWRVLDKYAAAAGGAQNHRHGLFDGILLKDNHIAAAGGVAAAVKSTLAAAPTGLRVQVEVQSLQEAEEALEAGADFLLLDNCEPARIREIAERCGDGVLLEASGGIRLENVRAHAAAGVHRVSVGAITHSAASSDLSLEVAEDAGPVRA
jgi:nicotinate-nucleotide pyrophosphorylase (carboxylating)